jgi:hypothetical protein
MRYVSHYDTQLQTPPSGSSTMEVFTIESQLVTIGPTCFEVVLPLHTLLLPTATVELTVVLSGALITIGTVLISLG